MSAPMRFDDRVAIVTGAAHGLGLAHARLLASRGARVVVNDFDFEAARTAADLINGAGGIAIADPHSVSNGDKIVETAQQTFGRVDIVICNAGILRDRSFKNMSDAEWRDVIEIHLTGSYKVARTAWPLMLAANYGRLVFTASAAGLYGNFGQANYSAAKLGAYGLTRTLAVEGASKNIKANCIAPLAASRLAASVFNDDMMRLMNPAAVSPLVGYLCHDECPDSGAMFEVGGGYISKVRWQRARGARLNPASAHGPEDVAAHWRDIIAFDDADYPNDVASCFAPFAKNLGIEMAIGPKPPASAREQS